MYGGMDGRRNDLGNRSQRSDRFSDHPGSDAGGASQGADAGDASQGPTSRSTIWGTDIDVLETRRSLEEFFDNFRKPGAEDDARPYYHMKLEELLHIGEHALNLDCTHLHSFNQGLYKQLVNYPGEMLYIPRHVRLRGSNPRPHRGSCAGVLTHRGFHPRTCRGGAAVLALHPRAGAVALGPSGCASKICQGMMAKPSHY